MPALESCTPCCVDTQTTNVPGPEGSGGIDGVNGIDAFTVTTADFTVPAVGSSVTVFVEESGWMVIGQPIFVEGPATFTVASITSATQVSLTFLGQTGDVAPAATITAGAGVSPGGRQGAVSYLSVVAAGTAYTMTATPALLDFGTTDPSLTITAAGTYLLFARVKYNYVGATFAAARTVTTKIRRTNNTAADVTNATGAFSTDIITTLTYIAGTEHIVAIPYQTANSNDVIEIWGDVSVVPTAGTLTATEASLRAVKIA